jgi:hypothetical protein
MKGFSGWRQNLPGCVALFVGKKGDGKSRSVEKSNNGTFPLRFGIPARTAGFRTLFHRPDYEGITGLISRRNKNS